MEQYMTNDQFQVKIGSEGYGFSKISNMVQEMEFDCIQEGGRNWSPVFFRKQKGKRDTLVLERGVKTQPTKIKAARIKTGTLLAGVVIILRKNNKSFRKYTFDEGVVTKLELNSLDALGREILIEKMEISHTGLYEIGV